MPCLLSHCIFSILPPYWNYFILTILWVFSFGPRINYLVFIFSNLTYHLFRYIVFYFFKNGIKGNDFLFYFLHNTLLENYTT